MKFITEADESLIEHTSCTLNVLVTYFVANYILRLFAESEVARDKLNLIERMQDAKIDFRQLLKFKDTIYAGDLDVDKEITEQ